MIEEINSASSNLRNSNESVNNDNNNKQDPLIQIVKILNGHLSQLQLIDQGATSLQQKVSLVQRESRGFNLNNREDHYNGNSSINVDGFSKSYLNRR